MYHSEKSAKEAREHFETTFQKKKPVFSVKIKLAEDLAKTIAPHTPKASVSDAKRLIFQGAVEVNGKVVKDPLAKVAAGDQIRIGSRTFGTAFDL
jgi:tyrosyl-tRNA synthetase